MMAQEIKKAALDFVIETYVYGSEKYDSIVVLNSLEQGVFPDGVNATGQYEMDDAKNLASIINAEVNGMTIFSGIAANIRAKQEQPQLLKIISAAECALADLEGIMTEFEPSGDRAHSGWQTITDLKSALKVNKRLPGETNENLVEKLREISKDSRRSKTAQLREIFEEVETAKSNGASNKEIVAGLAEHGLIFDVNNFKNARSRILKERTIEFLTRPQPTVNQSQPRLAGYKSDASVPAQSSSVDTLQDCLTRWESICMLSARLCNELEDAPNGVGDQFNTEELRHHALSDYTTELQQELQEIVDAFGQKDASDLTKTKQYSQREMESAVEIAHDAGVYGYRTENSRDTMQQFSDWAVEFEKVPYEDGDWMELIEDFAKHKMLSEVRGGNASFGLEYESVSYVAALAMASHSGKRLISVGEGNNNDFVGKILGATSLHVVQNLGRSIRIHSLIDLDRVPKVDEEVSIKYKGSKGTVFEMVKEPGQEAGR